MAASLLINFHSKKRLANLKKILEKQVGYDLLREIIVWNNNPAVKVSFDHPKVKIINSNFDVGLRCRWIMGAMAKEDCLFVQDDDILTSEEILRALHGKFLFNPERLYGIFGRTLNMFNKYELTDVYGNVDFVLTRLACFSKKLIPYILEFEDNTDRKFDGYPVDDITLSAVSRILYNKKPYSVDLTDFTYENLKDHNKGLHSQSGFNDKRTEYIAYVRQYFLSEPTIKMA